MPSFATSTQIFPHLHDPEPARHTLLPRHQKIPRPLSIPGQISLEKKERVRDVFRQGVCVRCRALQVHVSTLHRPSNIMGRAGC